MVSDSELLQLYAGAGSEEAFAELVRRHIDLVYTAALRRLGGDAHDAAETTQDVFVAMARSAGRLSQHPVLGAWLHTCTRHAAANVRRREYRRQLHKDRMHAMQESLSAERLSVEWEVIRHELDEAIDELSEKDRRAVVLRFFQGRSYPEIGRLLGVRDAAARMRVERGLEKLRGRLRRRGVSSSAAILSGALKTYALGSAPAGLAASIPAALGATSVGAVSLSSVATLMSIPKITGVLVGVAVVVGIGAVSSWRGANEANVPVVVTTPSPVVSSVEPGDHSSNLASIVRDKQARRVTKFAETGEAEEKITELRELLLRLPEQGIPELKLATSGDWHSAVEGPLESPEDYRRALGKIRASAERRFAQRIQPALRDYLKANSAQFPTDVNQLQTFVGPEIDGSMLQRYKIVSANEIPNVRMGGERIITQSEVIDSEYDAFSVIGPNGFGSTSMSPAISRDIEVLKPLMKAYQTAQGGRHSAVSELMPYASSPEHQAAIRRLAEREEKHRKRSVNRD